MSEHWPVSNEGVGMPPQPLEKENAWLRAALREAVWEYADHQSWRCEYPPNYYYADGPPPGMEGDCPCGLLAFQERVRAALGEEAEDG